VLVWIPYFALVLTPLGFPASHVHGKIACECALWSAPLSPLDSTDGATQNTHPEQAPAATLHGGLDDRSW
jgi:hypothetical protein